MEHGEPKREVVYNEDNENKMEDEDVYNEYMEQLLHLNTIPSVDDVVDINELISLIRSKNIMTEECLRKFGTLLELGGFEDDAAIKSKLFQLDFIIDSNESDDVIKKYFVVLLDNMYRFLSISIEKNRESLNLIEDLRRKIVGEELEGGKGMSNCEGRITVITSYLSSYNYNDLAVCHYDDFIVDILLAKPENGEKDFVYNVHYDSKEELNSFFIVLRERKVSIDIIKNHINFIRGEGSSGVSENWIWARDDGVKVIGSDGKYVIVRPLSSRDQEGEGITGSIEDTIAIQTGDNLIQSDLIFQGGNIRQTERYAFIGSDDILINAMDGEKSLNQNIKRIDNYEFDDTRIDEVIEKFKKLLGKEIIPIGLRKVNLHWEHDGSQLEKNFHIDLFITPLGDGRILIKKPSPTASDENKSFEKVKKDLEDLGLELCYIPDFLDLNYNNVLLENYGPEGEKVKKVYLPQYYNLDMRDTRKIADDLRNLLDVIDSGESLSDEQERMLEELGGKYEDVKREYDNATEWIENNSRLNYETENNKAREVWKGLGFKVIPISIDDRNIKNGGSLNCRTDESRVFE